MQNFKSPWIDEEQEPFDPPNDNENIDYIQLEELPTALR
jgi:hypothetical protein